ncbi:hypothetical protein JCM19240_5613 [Vibrio maritimus]|uniref:Uncharacterized protein n=1 Tax=Vibrio maritimus TaxID=990268 RepID=A0A090TLK1_9VIBR|nr:hypothetical protein JCM19240_5613 [Vibrio maritimus]
MNLSGKYKCFHNALTRPTQSKAQHIRVLVCYWFAEGRLK